MAAGDLQNVKQGWKIRKPKAIGWSGNLRGRGRKPDERGQWQTTSIKRLQGIPMESLRAKLGKNGKSELLHPLSHLHD